MGEVYRARDARLNRDVAIKVLPALFATDPERLARFTREAQVLASLNHPNIAAIYGVVDIPPEGGNDKGVTGGVALVMELVEGEDLSVLIARGPLPLADALAIARQIADALEAAHEQGIVHRDLKPANVKLRADGRVKVLDFGLAKAMDPPDPSGVNAMNSPTLTVRGTQMGIIVGTAAYMAPEQARGTAVDRRADIWAFGVVLYEMLTGRRVFEGENLSDILAAVLRQDVDWTRLPLDTPSRVRRLLERCLERDARQRLRDIGEARVEITKIEAGAPDTSGAAALSSDTRRRPISRVVWPSVAALMTAVAVAGIWWTASRPQPAEPLARMSLLPPPGVSLYPDSTAVAMSPDGRMVAFIVGSPLEAETELWVRSLDAIAPRRIEDSQGALLPFWSPDGRRIGFYTRQKLKTVAATGGPVDTICETAAARGAVWTRSNVIVFARDTSGPLFRVSANGGTPVPVTVLDASRKEYGHRFPQMLPDGDHFLYAALPARDGKFDIYAGSLSRPGRTLVAAMESAPSYADPGWLLYSRRGVLVAQAFDPRALAVTGDPITLDDEPGTLVDAQVSFTAGRAVTVSSAGSLAYYSSPSTDTRAQWYDRNGQPGAVLDLPRGYYDKVAIAPDGLRAVFVRSVSAVESSLWLADLARGGVSPLAAAPGRNDQPVWSPDSASVAFDANGAGAADLFIKKVGDPSPPSPIYRSDALFKNPAAWSPDGRWIVVTQIDPGTSQDIWLMPPSGGALRPFLKGPRRDVGRAVSPDGRWLAYLSDEAGRFQLYVQSFPEPGHLVQVTKDSFGAAGAWWSRDGRELLFVSADLTTLWRVDVTPGSTFTAGTPVRLAQLPAGALQIDFTPDRSRFLALVPARLGTGSITVVQHWRAALEGKR